LKLIIILIFNKFPLLSQHHH